MTGVRSRSTRFGLLVGVTTLVLTGELVTAPPSWAADPVDLGVADLTVAASASGGAFSVSGATGTDDLTITGDVVLTGSASPGRVVTITGGTVGSPRQITLQSVSGYSGADSAAIQLAAGAVARFTLSGTSTLIGSDSRPGLGIPVDAAAVITASSLAGRLDVNGSGNAAAIGGNGDAVLTEPAWKPVTITGLSGASCGSLAVTGGTVNATVASESATGAAIGGGRFGGGCTVSITGGVVNASARAAAGIGGGIGKDTVNGYLKDSPGGAGGSVSISGGTVAATSAGMTIAGESSPRYSAAIGGGRGGGGGAEDQGSDGAQGTLTITGGSVKLIPRTSDMAPDPKSGAQLLSQVRVNGVANVSQVTVTPEGGTATPFNVSANHPSDTSIYLFLPYPKTYAIAVTAGGTTTAYRAILASAGSDVTASIPPAQPANLSASAVAFEAAPFGYAVPNAKPVTILNTGGTAAVVASASVSPAGSFTVTKPSTVNVPAGGSNSSITVRPAAGLAVGLHEATIALTYGSGLNLSVPVSFTVTGSPKLQLSTPGFPTMTLGAVVPVERELTITNAGTAPASLTGVTSSNPAAFEVDNRVATLDPGTSLSVSVRSRAGLGVGTHRATITAAYAGGSASADVQITVDSTPVAIVKAGQTTLTLSKGNSLAIPALGYDGTGKTVALTWTSSMPSVARVSPTGVIVGVAAGNAVITAAAGDKSANITVKVLPKKPKTKVASVSGNVPTNMKIGALAYITGKYSPTSAPKVKITYSSSSTSVLTVDSVGTLKAIKEGKAIISIKAGGKTTKYTVTIS